MLVWNRSHSFFLYKEWPLISHYIFHVVQWHFAIFLSTSLFRSHRISAPYQLNNEASAISSHHHCWKFYLSKIVANFEINCYLMVQGQGYIVDVKSLLSQDHIIFHVLVKTLFCWNMIPLIYATFVFLFILTVSLAVDRKHLNWLYGSLVAAQYTQHFCNPTKLRA